MLIKGTNEFASFSEAAVCVINTYGGNMESEEEIHAVLDRLTDILQQRELYRTSTERDLLTPEELDVYDTLHSEAAEKW